MKRYLSSVLSPSQMKSRLSPPLVLGLLLATLGAGAAQAQEPGSSESGTREERGFGVNAAEHRIETAPEQLNSGVNAAEHRIETESEPPSGTARIEPAPHMGTVEGTGRIEPAPQQEPEPRRAGPRFE